MATKAELIAAALRRQPVEEAPARASAPAKAAPKRADKREYGTVAHVVLDRAGGPKYGFLRSVYDPDGRGDLWVGRDALMAQALVVGDHVSYIEQTNDRNGKPMAVELRKESMPC